jgi:hypothetical protein
MPSDPFAEYGMKAGLTAVVSIYIGPGKGIFPMGQK